jgi:hypothetical protein
LLTDVFKGRVRGADAEVGDCETDSMVNICESIVSAVEDLNDGVKDEVGKAVGEDKGVVKVIRLVVAIASIVEDEWV